MCVVDMPCEWWRVGWSHAGVSALLGWFFCGKCLCAPCTGFLSWLCHGRDLELDSKKPTAEDSPLTRKIRQLENRLDKAMIKYNEAQVGCGLHCCICSCVLLGQRGWSRRACH